MTVTITPTTYRKTDTPGIYFITIFGVEESTYVLTATTSHNALTLRNGESMHEKVLRRHYEYFKILLPKGQDLHIGVTAYGGDPDLYVSCKYNATQNDDGYPSILAGHYDWRGWSMGNDVVTITAAEKYTKCKNQNTVYAAVHGFEDSVFAITALAGNDTIVELEDGRPVQWIVEQYKYARFAVYTGGMSATNRPELNLELTPTNCDVDLYVKYCETDDLDECSDATKLDHDKSSKNSEGTETIVIQTVNTAVKWVVLGIYGFDAGEFTVAAWTTSPLVLLEGQAVMGQVDKHKYRYFKFHVETTADITITLTPLSGDVDLYVANGEKYSHPDKTICQSGHLTNETWCSRKPAMRVDVVKMIQAPAPYEYIIAVYGFSNSTYTIQGRSSDNSVVSLDQGLPQADEVDANGWRYYRIMAPAYNGGTLRVVTSTREGQIQLYANKCTDIQCICFEGTCPQGAVEKRPGKGTYTNLASCDVNSLDSFNGGSLNINVDPHVQHENSVAYIIGVHGISAHSEYTLTALVTGTHGHSLLMLQAGSAVNDFVEKNQYSYYRFSLMQSNKDLTFVVTPFSGDPDIYISTKYSYPNRTHYTWSHRSRGRDAITIAESDSKACHVSQRSDEGGMCDYFIAVHGYGAVATYTIMAYLHDNTPKILQRGIPQSGHANQTESQYYQFVITDKKENIVITLTPEDDGDPDLYILLGVIPEGGQSVSKTHYHFKSTSWREQETIRINHNDLIREKFCNTTSDVESNEIWQCQLNILVYGYRTSSYDIVASTDDRPIRLRNWKPMPGTIQPFSSEYFEFDVDGTSSTVDTFIILTPYNGDADLFVGVQCNFTNVDENHYQWVSVKSGSAGGDDAIDSVTILKTDANRCIPTVQKPCRYCIKVKNYESHSVLFSITGGTDAVDGGSAEMLSAGSELNGEVDAKKFRYYIYQKNADNNQISFSVTATSGAVTLYVSRVEIPGTGRVRFPQRCIKPQCTGYSRVDRSTYTWRSWRSHTQLVSISPSDKHFCVNCNYIIGVYNNGPGKARFAVSATSEHHTESLIPGLAKAGSVNEGSYEYYKMPITNPTGYLNILVMPTNADGRTEQDLYVGFGDCDAGCIREPTKTTNDAKSEQLGAECFFVNLEDFCTGNKVDSDGVCLVFFGVYGRKGNNGQYKILAERDNAFNSTIKLSAGEPLLGCVRNQGMTYYQHLVDNNHLSRVTITLTPLTLSSDPDLYVTLGDNNIPTRSHADFRSYQSNGDDIIIVQKGDPKFKEHCPSNKLFCKINVGVYGFQEASFTITISTGVTDTLLLSGVPASGYVTKGGYDYYRFTVPVDTNHDDHMKDDITIVLDTPSGNNGDPDLLVSNHDDKNQYPILSDHTSYQWHENSRGGGFLYISHTEKNYKYGNDFVIGVYGFTNATYTLLVNIGVQPTTLNIGQQIEGKALANSMQYYKIKRGLSTEDVMISVMPFSGRPFLYALATKDHQLPSTKHYQQSSRSYHVKSRNTVIMKNGTDIPPGVDTILAGVFGYNGVATYKIRAQLCGKVQTLQDAYAYHDLGACSRNDMSSFQYDLATPLNEYNVDEDDMPAFGKCKLEISFTKISGTPTFAFGLDPMKKPTCRSNAATKKVTCENDIKTLQTSLDSVWYKSSLIEESSTDFATHKGKIYVTAYSPDNAVYGISVTRRCEGNFAPSIISLGASGGFVPSFTTNYPFCDIEMRSPRTRLCGGGTSETRESAFFKFQVSKSDFKDQLHTISITIFGLEKSAGDDMLTLYVTSCLKSTCGQRNVVPGPNVRHDNVAGVFIPPDSLTYFIEGSENECMPTDTDNCVYYLGLYAQKGSEAREIPFGLKVYVSNSGQRTVIVNENKVLVGGHAQVVCGTENCNKQLSYLIPSYGKEGSPKEKLHAQLEVCQGDVVIETCNAKALITDDCEKNKLEGKTLKSKSGYLPDAKYNVEEMTLEDVEPTANTYMTAYGTGTFKFYLDRGCPECKELILPTEDVKGDIASIEEGVGLSLSWKTSTIKYIDPAKKLKNDPIEALGANYMVYLIEAGKKEDTATAIPPANAVLYTPCGLQTLASDQPQITKYLTIAGNQGGTTEVKVDDLKPGTHYIVTVVAVCDENCQKGNVNAIEGEAYDCDKVGKVICKAYKSIQIVTGAKKISYGVTVPVIVTIVLVICCSCIGFVVWKKRVSNEQREQYQMQDVSSLNFSLDSLNKGLAGKKGSRYQPLVSGYDDDGGGGYEDEGNASLITHF